MSRFSWFSLSTIQMIIYIIGLGGCFLTPDEYAAYELCWNNRELLMQGHREAIE